MSCCSGGGGDSARSDAGSNGGCGRVWTGLHVLWSIMYVCAGAVQIVIGIFFLISLPALRLCCNVWAGSWNVVAGIGSGMLACFGDVTPRRQEWLLYVSLSLLVVNSVNAVLSEWTFYTTELVKFSAINFHTLLGYARITAGITAAGVLIASFLDSQLTFCSIDATRAAQKRISYKKSRDSHDQVSDIEYIIPRQKPNNEPKADSSLYNSYAQSWVFDADTTAPIIDNQHQQQTAPSPYLKIKEEEKQFVPNGKGSPGSCSGSGVTSLASSTTRRHHREDSNTMAPNPVVHIEEVSDDSTSNSDRKLCYMKSFSRTPSPVALSAASSQISLNNSSTTTATATAQPPMYECLEKLTEQSVYRSRLDTALSTREDDSLQQHSPRKSEIASPRATEQVQYASLIMELERALTNKKDRAEHKHQPIVSPKPHVDDDDDECSSSSKSGSHKTDPIVTNNKGSDADFSKELEAALQLIQDLESPNTADTPSDTCQRSLPAPLSLSAAWRHSDDGSEKTLSAVNSLSELTSPLAELQPDLYSSTAASMPAIATGVGATFRPHQGKHYGGIPLQPCQSSRSTSGYSSPGTPHRTASSSPDETNGSAPVATDPKQYGCSIRNTSSSAVITLYPEAPSDRAVTVIQINGSEYLDLQNNNVPEKSADKFGELVRRSSSSGSASWNVRSLLKKRKPVPRLPPELEGAIIKSESLAHLTDLELMARHERNREVQRQIEQRVQQQLCQMTESSY